MEVSATNLHHDSILPRYDRYTLPETSSSLPLKIPNGWKMTLSFWDRDPSFQAPSISQLGHKIKTFRRGLLGRTVGMNPVSDMDVSENSGTPKSSILIGFSIVNHPFWGTTIYGNTHMLPVETTKKWLTSSQTSCDEIHNYANFVWGILFKQSDCFPREFSTFKPLTLCLGGSTIYDIRASWSFYRVESLSYLLVLGQWSVLFLKYG